jgi:hypothetical protein
VGADCYGRCAGVVAGHVESLRACEWGYFVGAYLVGVGGFADDPRGRKLMSKQILDPASGSRMFYFDKADERVVFGDIRNERHILSDGRKLVVEPDTITDFRDLQFADKQFKLVIFDPPHMVSLGLNSWMAKKYGRLEETWETDLAAGFSECWRVLDDYGTLIFKWNECQIPVSKILSLFSESPVMGHRSGKASKTHWIVFFKLSDSERVY